MRAAALLLLLLAVPLRAQADSPLQQRAREMAALLAAEPQVDREAFDPSFLQVVPPAQMDVLGRQLHARCGEVTGLALVERSSEWSGKFEAGTARGFAMPMTVTVSATPPHRVVGLWFGQPVPRLASLAEVAAALGELPGQVTLLAARLADDAEPETLAARAPDTPLAIGSAFKLWLLGTLAQDALDGTRRWDQVETLRAEWKSLPSGRLHEWPDGAPVTLHTLATAMISESDNTATDHLMHLLGRERIEERLPALGVRDASRPRPGAAPRNRPLLATAEMFRMKLAVGGEPARVWSALRAEETRRRYLEEEVASLPLTGPGTDPGAFAAPSSIAELEWFASAADLVRTLDALRRLAQAPAAGPRDASPLRGVLSVNPGLPVAREAFAWCGYKGGSEPGVLCMAWLLQRRDGGWCALAAAWNDPAAVLDEARLTAPLARALQLLAADG